MSKLTTGQAAKWLQVSSQTVLRLIWLGEIKAERLTSSGQYRILEDELDQYAKRHGLTLLPDRSSK